MNNSTASVPWFEKEKKVFKNPLNHHAYIFEGVEGIRGEKVKGVQKGDQKNEKKRNEKNGKET